MSQGERLSPRIWFAVAVGLLGSCLVAYDGMSPEAISSESMSATVTMMTYLSPSDEELKGVLLLLASCLFYSMAVIRLGAHGE